VQDIEVQKYASALEAPLNVCETFSIAAQPLAVCCGPWWASDPKWKRLGLVFVVGLLAKLGDGECDVCDGDNEGRAICGCNAE
jgi:hypothetical protein